MSIPGKSGGRPGSLLGLIMSTLLSSALGGSFGRVPSQQHDDDDDVGSDIYVKSDESVGLLAFLLKKREDAIKDQHIHDQRVIESQLTNAEALLECVNEFTRLKPSVFETILDVAPPDGIEAEIAKVAQEAHSNLRNLIERLKAAYDEEAEQKRQNRENRAAAELHQQAVQQRTERAAQEAKFRVSEAARLEAEAEKLRAEATELEVAELARGTKPKELPESKSR